MSSPAVPLVVGRHRATGPTVRVPAPHRGATSGVTRGARPRPRRRSGPYVVRRGCCAASAGS
ncbi:hypothetical protein [Nocardioides marinisabuli]|uniref:hypothetical protein n=1 Tax=Nocardioides marinisabuli TaxID=419476 RepID=UPI0015DD9B97|nr:hypothetical protein [Nocardioides marinisabuli]